MTTFGAELALGAPVLVPHLDDLLHGRPDVVRELGRFDDDPDVGVIRGSCPLAVPTM